MSGTIQPQADVGMLGLQGLSAFSSILAILSADNVVPMALLQLQSLGTMLPTNGDYAEKTKTLLQRCSDNRLNLLGVAIGWRKNDSASLMAESAGGQAAALLSMCLANLFKSEDYGRILSHLCSALLPRSMHVSSMSQLADAAKLLAAKLKTLGFGNLLACEVTKIHRVYTSLGEAAPKSLLDTLTAESVTKLFKLISRALCEEEILCRVSGVQGMGHILGLLQALCPRSTIVTVEGVLIQDTQDRNIIVDFLKEHENEPVSIHLETKISALTHVKLPIRCSKPGGTSAKCSEIYCFQWSGWLADWLQLAFLRHGLSCDQDILNACCDLLMSEFERIQVSPTDIGQRASARIPPIALPTLLGPIHSPRVFEVCKTIWRAIPELQSTSWIDPFNKLVEAVRRVTQKQVCSCKSNRCDLSTSWSIPISARKDHWLRLEHCVIYNIWHSVFDALDNGIRAFFIEPGQNAIASIQIHLGGSFLRDMGAFNESNSKLLSVTELYAYIMDTPDRGYEIALNRGSCTMYPAVLDTLSVPSSRSVIFKLVDGRIVFAGRYHMVLKADGPFAQAGAQSPLTTGAIRPSHIGVESRFPLITVREDYWNLIALCSVQYAGNIVNIDLTKVIHGYMAMRWANPCNHPVDDCLDTSKYKAMSTSVARPAAENAIGVAMTRWNPVAQLLCCRYGHHQVVLQRDCCLNCALEGIKLSDDPRLVIIVG